MATVRYTVANGQILAEKRGGTRKFYRSDALGSTIALYDDSQAKTDTFTYWPYGETRTSSGSTGTKYKFVGTYGYRTQGTEELYVGARILRTKDGRWMTVDPIRRARGPYSYCSGRVQSTIDRTGRMPEWVPFPFSGPRPFPKPIGPPPIGGLPGAPPPGSSCKAWNEFVYNYCNNCYGGRKSFIDDCVGNCNMLSNWYYRNCKDPNRRPIPGENWRPPLLPNPGVIIPIGPPRGPCLDPPLYDPPLHWGVFDRHCEDALASCLNQFDWLCGGLEGTGIGDKLCNSIELGCYLGYAACKGVDFFDTPMPRRPA